MINLGDHVTVIPREGYPWYGIVTVLHVNRDGRLNGIARVMVTDPGNTRYHQGDHVDVGTRTLAPGWPR
jgi:hypothetical protein